MDSLPPPPPPSLPPFGLLLLPLSSDSSVPSLAWPDLIAGATGATLRLVSAHSRHFLALSCLLLLPLSLLLLSLPAPFPGAIPSVSLQSPQDSWSNPLLLLALVAALLYLAAFAAAAASAHAGFFGRPVKLLASFLSVPASVLRLLLTALPASPLLLIPLLPLPAALGSAIALLGVSLLAPFWSLAGAAAIVESTAGSSPLRQSCRLLSGARLAALSVFLVFAAGIGLVLWGFSGVAMETYDAATGWAGMAPVVAKAMVGTAVLAAMMLYGMVINVVLYMHCRALHGELTGEIYNEFASSYVYLPFDEGSLRFTACSIPLRSSTAYLERTRLQLIFTERRKPSSTTPVWRDSEQGLSSCKYRVVSRFATSTSVSSFSTKNTNHGCSRHTYLAPTSVPNTQPIRYWQQRNVYYNIASR